MQDLGLKHFKISSNYIYVWNISLAEVRHKLTDLLGYLSLDERIRADRLVPSGKYDQFVISRGMLKVILAEILGVTPGAVVISSTKYGKPYIKDEKSLHFNLSHSDYRCTIAIALGQRIGVDIEKIDAERNYIGLSRRFFSAREKAELDVVIPAISDTEYMRRFYICWTRKEAFVKALERGVGYGFGCFDVSVDPKQELTKIKCHAEPHKSEDWFNIVLECGAGYVAALAVSEPKAILYQNLLH